MGVEQYRIMVRIREAQDPIEIISQNGSQGFSPKKDSPLFSLRQEAGMGRWRLAWLAFPEVRSRAGSIASRIKQLETGERMATDEDLFRMSQVLGEMLQRLTGDIYSRLAPLEAKGVKGISKRRGQR